jgi:tetratricopeptide (TPR) repeat protein
MDKNGTTYNAKIFDVKDIQEAKNIILTPEAGMQTDERWEIETNYLSKEIQNYFNELDENSIVVDYGCGIGRLSKELIDTIGCRVIGVDISSSMRELAKQYVQNDKFEAISTKEFRDMILDGLRVDGAISIWVIQHSNDPLVDVALLKASLKKDALFYLLNNKISAVPTNKGWINNGIDVYNLLNAHFTIKQKERLPQEVAKDKLSTHTFIAKMVNNKQHILPKNYSLKMKEAVELFQNKNYTQAKEIYTNLINSYPIFADAYNGMAVCLKANKENLQIVNRFYLRAIHLEPLNGYIYNNLANSFKLQTRYKEAIFAQYDAIRTNRQNPEFYNNLGLLYEKTNEQNKAIEAYKTAVKVDNSYTKAINNLGVLLYHNKMYEQSASVFQVALNIDPAYTDLYSNMGAALNKAQKYPQAIEALNKAIKANPKNGGAYTNMGNVYNKIHEYKKAVSYHEQSIKLDNKGYNAYSNVGTSYKNLGQSTKAINSYKKAIELKDDFENAHFDLATVYLAQKDFQNGWAEYEWRFKKDEMKGHLVKHNNIFSKRRFDGIEDITDKTLLIHTEQGFGDSIMFVKFVELIKKRFRCKVVLQCRDELRVLFENSIKNVDIFYSRDSDSLPSFDYHYPMLSLPYLFGVKSVKDIPNSNPYLYAKDEKDLDIVKQKDKIDIGICWSASVTGESYDGKVFDVEYFRPIIQNKKFNIYTLQVGIENEELKKANLDTNVIDMTDKLDSFNKTAYLINQLDLVISSDTSVAHLAGALGKELIVPLQKIPDWRWENKGDKSYWYPSAELFRQKTARVWQGVFQSIYAKMNKRYKVRLKLK